jgi:BirA family biotin operon repressor/biotin-[acetyl-CoA-carboxylase] ligase
MKVTALQPSIKWPNDVFIGGKKVAGILTEMRCEVDKVNYVVLGIGVNVSTPSPFLEKMTGGIGTSLDEQSQGLVSRFEFVQNLLQEFEILYMKFLTSGFGSVRKEWIRLNNTIGSVVKISDDGEEVEGKAVDIDEDGFLLIRLDNGDIKRIVHGDVSVSKYMT